MIFVVGGTSRLGSAVARKLRAAGAHVRASCRKPARAEQLRTIGVEAVELDLRRHRDFDRTLSGADAVLISAHGLTSSAHDATASVDIEGHKQLIFAAEKAGVKRLVYISALGASLASRAPFWRAKAEVEHFLGSTDLDYVILRPAAFMDLYAHELIGKPVLAGKAAPILGDGRTKRNLIAVDDVADIAVRALTEPEFSRQTLEIGGADNMSDRDVAALYARLANKPLRIMAIPTPALAVLSTLIGPFHAGVAAIMRLPSQLKGVDLTFDGARTAPLLGRAPLGVEAYARAAMAAA